jgi:PST family polysaccharide transporter
LFADKILRMGVGLFVGVWIARYLGPEQFGLWNFALAFTALFAAFATLGLDAIVVRELVKNPERQNELLGSAFALKLIGGAITLLIALLAISLVRSGETLTLWLVGLSAAGFIFQSVNVIDFYFQAKVQSRYTVYAANGAFVLMTLVKIYLLLTSAPLIAFAWAGLGEIALTAIFLLAAYRFNHHNMREWRYDGRVARELLRDSWPLILSSIAIMIYMRIDQIMIGQMLGDKEVGLYSAAVRISEVWYFIPMAIVSSVFPAIIDAKKKCEALYYQRLQKLYNLLAILALAVAIPMTFLADWVMELLFGREYFLAGPVLSISIWCGLFASLSVASGKWFINEGYTKLALKRNLYGAVLNIVLNYYLIPIYGMLGAAFSTLLSFALAAYISDVFSKATRIVFYQKTKAILLIEIFKRIRRWEK